MVTFTMDHKEYRLAAIMYTDICGFSRMMEQDEDVTLEMLNYHNKLVHEQVGEFNGKVIKTIGDAFLATFNNTFDATKCAVQIQHELASYNSTRQGLRLILRIGIHLGDIYFFENDALGEGINIASRLQALTKPGRICISKEVYNMVSNKLDLEIVPLGKVRLKNITRDIHAYEIKTESSMEYERSNRPPDMGEEETGGPTPNKPPHPPEEPIDFNELKDLVVSQIRQAGRRMREEQLKREMPSRSESKKDRVLHKLEEKGYLSRLEKPNGQVSYGLGTRTQKNGTFGGAPYLLFRKYKKSIEKKAASERNGFRGHLISFIAVNGMLFFINMFTGGSFPWFLFPLGGWGIGLVSHMNSVRLLLKQKEELDKMPELTPPQLKILKKIHKMENGFSGHIVSNIAVILFLFMINMITSPGFPWFIFPAVGMGIGIVTHWLNHAGKIRRLKKELDRQIKEAPVFVGSYSDGMGKSAADADTIVRQAEQLKNNIITQMKNLGEDQTPLGEDMLPVLDNYIDQIKELAGKNEELERVIAGFPTHELEKDTETLQKKLEESDSEYMKKEYQRSITEVDKQLSSFKELKNQKELIGLRLTSSVNALKQMQIDLARMHTLSASSNRSSVDLIKEKSNELREYLKDLESSYRELDDQQ